MTDETPQSGSELIRAATMPGWVAPSFFRTRNAHAQVSERSTIPEEPINKQHSEDPGIVAGVPNRRKGGSYIHRNGSRFPEGGWHM